MDEQAEIHRRVSLGELREGLGPDHHVDAHHDDLMPLTLGSRGVKYSMSCWSVTPTDK